jgi:predicted dehydrogenase
MEAGKHVISAVPVAHTLEGCRAVVAAQKRTGRTYMMAETSWYRPETILARELHRDGAFGRLVYSESEYYHPNICHDADGLSHWKGERTWRYGYPPLLYPTHSTAFLVGVTGERLVRVSALGWGSGDDALADNAYRNPFWNGAAMFRTSGRCRGSSRTPPRSTAASSSTCPTSRTGEARRILVSAGLSPSDLSRTGRAAFVARRAASVTPLG